MKDEILAFIKHFQNDGTIKAFTNGCCYWFAIIIATRFFDYSPVILYHPINNHFAVEILGHIYDITGELPKDENWVNWASYVHDEPSDTERVFHNCILKLE